MTWLRKNLFSTWYNSLLTVVCLLLLFFLGWMLTWIITQAQWEVIAANLRLFMVGRYPRSLDWRIWIAAAVTSTMTALTWGVSSPQKVTKTEGIIAALAIAIFLALPADLTSRLILGSIALLALIAVWLGKKFTPTIASGLTPAWLLLFPIILLLIGGGIGLRAVPTSLWNGLLLTLFMAAISIILSFPIGVLLALGRSSDLPVLRWFCILYIEIIRGLPLIGILFLAQVMLPLFLPAYIRLDRVLRAIAGLILFSAAYMAENVRGGLQAIPRGQTEAAQALGLNRPQLIMLIILPQALRAVIPAIVGQFIGLFKDTSLLSLVGLLELMGIARSVLAQPQFLGRSAEVYLFVGLIYWLFCYSMSLASRKLEKQLDR